MKRLKLLILALGLLTAPMVLAVTLPTTSYSDTYTQMSADGVFTSATGTMYTSSFGALGDGSTVACEEACQAAFDACMAAGTKTFDECGEEQLTCMDACGEDDTPLGPDSPIEGGLWILLTLALATCVVRLTISGKWRLFDK